MWGFVLMFTFYSFMYFCLCWVFITASGGYSLVGVRKLLIVVTSPVGEHGLQQLWHPGLAASQHVGSSRTRDRTCIPCISRQTLNHRATREVQYTVFCDWLPSLSMSNVFKGHPYGSMRNGANRMNG